MLVVDAATVRALLPMGEAIGVMREALARYSAGEVAQPLRAVVAPSGAPGLLATMPVWDGAGGGFGVKAVLVYPGNTARGLGTHQGAVLMFDPGSGVPSAVLDASAITAVRTAAVSAVATAALATPDAGDLAVLGAGTQARSHLEAIAAVRRLRRVRVWNRTPARAAALAAWAGTRFGPAVEVVASPDAALDGADLACTTLACDDPVVAAGMVGPGAHLNAVGACTPTSRELAGEVVAAATVFVDSRESALAEAGDLIIPIRAGELAPGHIAAELGEVLLGRHPGRTRPDEVTLFKSLGIAVEDLAAGCHVERAARARGLGVEVPFG